MGYIFGYDFRVHHSNKWKRGAPVHAETCGKASEDADQHVGGPGAGCWGSDFGFRVSGLWVSGSGFGVSEFRVSG